MRKWVAMIGFLVAITWLFGCNKQKPPQLDYTKKMEAGLYDPQGLPGESHVGTTPEDSKHHGYQPTTVEEAGAARNKENKKKTDIKP